MESILMLLDKDARMSVEQIAAAAGITVEEAKQRLADYEAAGVIKGYKALIDWEKTGRNYVTAEIEAKIVLGGKMGFDDIAEVLASFEEVESVYLMSGGYDISMTVSGKTFQEIAMFVASKLSPIEGVQATSTNFVLKKYKERGTLTKKDADIREVRT